MLLGLICSKGGKYSHDTILALHLACQSPQTPAAFMEKEDHLENLNLVLNHNSEPLCLLCWLKGKSVKATWLT